MNVVIWVLNILQVVIVYFILYALYFYGIIEYMPEETGLNFKSLFPIFSLIASVSLWKIYSKISLWIISDVTQTKVSEIKITKSNVVTNKTLYTFFFGYASLKWRRLFRTLIILPALAFFIAGVFLELIEQGDIKSFMVVNLAIAGYFILIGLISWLIKPFVVKEG